MRYLRVRWVHDYPDEPLEIYSEVDDQGWERRKIEVFRDGSAGSASVEEATEGTMLSLAPLPSIEEIARDPQFRPEEISGPAFDRKWAAVCPVSHPH